MAPIDRGVIERTVTGARADALVARAAELRSIVLGERELVDLELIASGAATPLAGFVGRADYAAILAHRRLANGAAWPIPMTVATDNPAIAAGDRVVLRDSHGTPRAVLHVGEAYAREVDRELDAVYGTTDPAHPGVADTRAQPRILLGGDVEVLPLPTAATTPRALRAEIARRGWHRVAGFGARGPLTPGDEHRVRIALELCDGAVIHTRAGAPPAILSRLPHDRVIAASFPGIDRHAPDREAALALAVAANYGITDPIVDAPIAVLPIGAPSGPTITPLVLAPPVHCHACDALVTARSCPHDYAARATPPQRGGFILWFTGMSGAGKSTLAAAVAAQLRERRAVEILDGDEVRTHLSAGLGFSKQDRDTNVHRIGFVARTLAAHGVGVVTAAISPYRDTRRDVRELAAARGITFIEVFANASLDALVTRDVKGLYKQALAGKVAHFTGVSDPYEAPVAPDVEVFTDRETIAESAAKIVAALRARGVAGT